MALAADFSADALLPIQTAAGTLRLLRLPARDRDRGDPAAIDPWELRFPPVRGDRDGISQRTLEHSPESAAYQDEMATSVQAVADYTV